MPENMLERDSRRLCAVAIAAGDVANYCDHAEHNEVVEARWILEAAATLVDVAFGFAIDSGSRVQDLYAIRLAQIEGANVLYHDGAFDGAAAVRGASTWRDLQLVQAAHDRAYHPDVCGMSRSEQLRHYAFHVAKLAAACARRVRGDDDAGFLTKRVPDLVLFGVKLHTSIAVPMPATGLDAKP